MLFKGILGLGVTSLFQPEEAGYSCDVTRAITVRVTYEYAETVYSLLPGDKFVITPELLRDIRRGRATMSTHLG